MRRRPHERHRGTAKSRYQRRRPLAAALPGRRHRHRLRRGRRVRRLHDGGEEQGAAAGACRGARAGAQADLRDQAEQGGELRRLPRPARADAAVLRHDAAPAAGRDRDTEPDRRHLPDRSGGGAGGEAVRAPGRDPEGLLCREAHQDPAGRQLSRAREFRQQRGRAAPHRDAARHPDPAGHRRAVRPAVARRDRQDLSLSGRGDRVMRQEPRFQVNRNRRPAGLFAVLAVLVLPFAAGCGGGMDDLNAYIDEVKARPGDRPDPLPEIQTYESYVYTADVDGLRSPFVPDSPVADTRSAGGGGIRPDVNRSREYLQQGETTYGLVQTADGLINRVTVGNYVGQNDGRIVEINESEIVVKEIVSDGIGGYLERDATISISD